MFLFLKPWLTADIVPFTLMQQEILPIFEDPYTPPPPHLAHIELSQSSLTSIFKKLDFPRPSCTLGIELFLFL